jgi:hypothetical protein
VSGLTSTHKNFWECDTGIAYLISGDLARAEPLPVGPSGWRTGRMTKIYDLGDPTKPVFIRDFGLAGQEPGSAGPVPVAQGVHGPIVLGNRLYFAHGTSRDGLLQIVDRQKLLAGPRAPTAANLSAPEISRLWMSPNWGAHTAFTGARSDDRGLAGQHQGPDARLRRAGGGGGRQRVQGVPSRQLHDRHHRREPALLRRDLPGAGVPGKLLQPGWSLRAALEQRVVRADLLPQDGLRRLLQRRRACRRHPRSVRAARGRLLHPGPDRADRGALRDERRPRIGGH